jgi:hypothetical protein
MGLDNHMFCKIKWANKIVITFLSFCIFAHNQSWPYFQYNSISLKYFVY